MSYHSPRAWPLSQLTINLQTIDAHGFRFKHEVRPGLDRLPVCRVLSASPLEAALSQAHKAEGQGTYTGGVQS